MIKGEARRLLRKNSLKAAFEENIKNIKLRLLPRGYQKIWLKKNIRCQIYRKVIGIEANKRHLQTNIAFRDTVSTMDGYLTTNMFWFKTGTKY